MSVTQTTRFGIDRPGASTDGFSRAQFLDLIDAVETLAALYGQGTHTARTAVTPGIPGRIYRETDTGLVYWDDGAAWRVINQSQDLSGYATTTAVASALAGKLGTSAKAADSELLDGIDSTTFARRDQAVNFSGPISEAGARVYSPNNPPPAAGAMIAQTIRGLVSGVTGSTVNVTIPAVNVSKAQVRNLGATGFLGSGTNQGPGYLTLVNATTLQYAVGGTTGASIVTSYEITEWT